MSGRKGGKEASQKSGTTGDGTAQAKPASEQRPGRLPSLRGPRDLTLGGVRKKTFTPNIPTRKDRVKQDHKDGPSKAPEKRDRQRRDRQRGRGRGRGRPEIIQSHSIFEAGPSAEALKKRSDAGYASVGGGGGGGPGKDAIEKPTIKKEEYDEEYEKAKSAEALISLEGGPSFVADLENDDTLMPTALPMSISKGLSGEKPSSHVKDEKPVKLSKSHHIATDCASVFTGDTSNAEDPTSMLIFQLPDTLPAVTVSNEQDIKSEPPTANIKQESDTENCSEDKNCTLDQLSEGYVGKLQVTKSGRCLLVLGQIKLDLNLGTPTAFHEEVVSVRLPPASQAEVSQGHMTVLGDVSQKIVCTPNMEQLILQGK